MQIDFHHAVTYVLAIWAGFSSKEANIIAYSSQFVDDAVCDKAIQFTNGALYKPLASAHKELDYRNFDKLANSFVWIPFHFLPGNLSLPDNSNKTNNYFQRIICQPDSSLAQELLTNCIEQGQQPNGLYRLGITLHVYADTWAHYGFSGITHYSNLVEYIEDVNDTVSAKLIQKVSRFFKDIFYDNASKFIDGVLPLGHGAVLSYPDLPYLTWKYKDYQGRLINRNNISDYLAAAKNMYIALRRFRLGDSKAQVEGLTKSQTSKLTEYFESIRDEIGIIRHQKWLEAIRQGFFTGQQEQISYADKGPGSWEYEAFGDDLFCALEFSDDFLSCNWKLFHDALQDHHYYLTRKLFPSHGLCIT